MIIQATVYYPDGPITYTKGQSISKSWIITKMSDDAGTLIIRMSRKDQPAKSKYVEYRELVTFGIPWMADNFTNNNIRRELDMKKVKVADVGVFEQYIPKPVPLPKAPKSTVTSTKAKSIKVK